MQASSLPDATSSDAAAKTTHSSSVVEATDFENQARRSSAGSQSPSRLSRLVTDNYPSKYQFKELTKEWTLDDQRMEAQNLSSEPSYHVALKLAERLHSGQNDKADRPYISHPMRVAARAYTLAQSIYSNLTEDVGLTDILSAAALHDTMEDCGATVKSLREEGINTPVIEAVKVVSILPELDITTGRMVKPFYPEFIQRIADSGNETAIIVKLADLEDNSDEDRDSALPLEERQKALQRREQKYSEPKNLLVKTLQSIIDAKNSTLEIDKVS